jgi:nucleoid DNA-binding protein
VSYRESFEFLSNIEGTSDQIASILRIAVNTHLFQRDVKNVVTIILDKIELALARGSRVELLGFSSFAGRDSKAALGEIPVLTPSFIRNLLASK